MQPGHIKYILTAALIYQPAADKTTTNSSNRMCIVYAYINPYIYTYKVNTHIYTKYTHT